MNLKTDAHHLLCHVLQKNRAYLFAHPDLKLTPEQEKLFQSLLKRREQGEPIAYLIGSKGFWKYDFRVTEDTLIPRPETELLIEITLGLLDTAQPARILDLGTGSGAIAISLALESDHWHVTATDQSAAALKIAGLNLETILIQEVERSGISQQAHTSENCSSRLSTCAKRVVFLKSNWFDAVQGTFDLIVSNPPYIADNDPHLQEGDLRFEPQSALASGKEGLDDLRIIINEAPQYLKPDGILMVEHGYDQQEPVQTLFKQAGFNHVQTLEDLQGHPRISLGKLFTDTEGRENRPKQIISPKLASDCR